MSETRIGFCLFKSTAISVEKIQRRYLLITSSLTLHCSYTFSVFLSKYGITLEERTESEGICSYILPRHQLNLKDYLKKRNSILFSASNSLCSGFSLDCSFQVHTDLVFRFAIKNVPHTSIITSVVRSLSLSLSSVHLLLKDSFFKRPLQSDCACDVQHKWETQLNPNSLTVGHSGESCSSLRLKKKKNNRTGTRILFPALSSVLALPTPTRSNTND